uniref:Uncharacterized protein n=1 Tax=Triticum urartu TaxID=4572 RepID=A0A8R7TNY7_TRIUA
MHHRSPSPAPPLEPTGERLEVEEIPVCLSTGSGSAPVTLPPSIDPAWRSNLASVCLSRAAVWWLVYGMAHWR